VNVDQVGWSSVNFWTWGGDGSHAPKSSDWPGDKVTTTTTVGGKKWYTQTYTINEEDDAVSFVFSTGSGSPQTVDIADVTTNKFYEISASKDGEKHKVNDVTESYITGIKELTAPNSEPTTLKVYTLDGRLLRTAKNGSDALNGLNKGVYIVNGKKVIVR
jgi:alpha-amylase